jgi:DNA (cytosine-5)-methyltransferase 1
VALLALVGFKMTTEPLTCIDLFCGAGGLSHGFELAGFKVLAAVDFDPIARATYQLQNPDVPFFYKDIRKVTGKSLLEAAGRRPDLVIGGPSCQGFSTHGKRDPNDPRNFLFKHFIRIVKETKPTWVVMENVKGMLTYDSGYYRKKIHSSFEKIGYRVESKVLRAVEYGVPQQRERLIFIATKSNAEITFPMPTHCAPELAEKMGLEPFVTVRDAIGDLHPIGIEGESTHYLSEPRTEFQKRARVKASKSLILHRAKRVSDLAMSIIKYVPQGDGIRALPVNRLPERFKKMRTTSTGALRRDCTTLYYRLSWDKPAYTITCNFTNVSSGPFVHPTANRAITPREAARLQSFPDNYRFVEQKVQRQIGNAVPPLLARAVALELRKKFAPSIRTAYKSESREEANALSAV